MASQWRADAPVNLVELAVGKCLISEMDRSGWTELGLITGTKGEIEQHDRLLRSLRFGDEDYAGHVYDMVPAILGNTNTWGPPTPTGGLHTRYPRLQAVTDYLDLPAWLALNESELYGRLFADDGQEPTLPDGTVLSEAEAAAVRMGVAEMKRQVARIRRDYAEDPEAAIGQAKELLESTCKTILGITGDGGQTPDLPGLIKQTQLHLGIDPSQVSDGVEARSVKRLLGGVANILNAAGELRNARGTGHGRSGSELVDPALARLAVGLVLPTVVYLVEVWEVRASTSPTGQSKNMLTMGTAKPEVGKGDIYLHATFGEGQIVETSQTDHGVVATVDFGPRIGSKRILIRT
jgi:hypothetical protein